MLVMEPTKTHKKTYDWLKPYQFQKDNPGGPGRPKGQSLKEFAREFLMNLPPEEKLVYLSCMPEDLVWKMAEGNPKQEVDGEVKAVLNVIVPKEVAEAFNINESNTETSGSNKE